MTVKLRDLIECPSCGASVPADTFCPECLVIARSTVRPSREFAAMCPNVRHDSAACAWHTRSTSAARALVERLAAMPLVDGYGLYYPSSTSEF